MSNNSSPHQNGVKTNILVKKKNGVNETIKSKKLVRGGSPLEISVPLFDGKTMWVRVNNINDANETVRVAGRTDDDDEEEKRKQGKEIKIHKSRNTFRGRLVGISGEGKRAKEWRSGGGGSYGVRVAGGADDEDEEKNDGDGDGGDADGGDADGGDANDCDANDCDANRGEANGENADGENADGENADGENAEGENADDENADGEKADDENADGEKADDENADGEKADGEDADGEKGDGENADGENADGENADGENADGENADGENADGEKADGEKADGENADGEKADGEKADGENKAEVNPNKKCYCKAQPYPRVDIVSKARRAMEEEILPITRTLCDIQDKVRQLHIHEKNNCICGVALSTILFPNKPCACVKPPRNNNKKVKVENGMCECSKKRCARRKNGDEEQFVKVGCLPITSGRQTQNGQTSRKPNREDETISNKPAPETKSPNDQTEPRPKSNIKAHARSAFYTGVVSHYMGNTHPPRLLPHCGCSSIDSLDSLNQQQNTYTKTAPCAQTKFQFPMRPGQPMWTDPDDVIPCLFEEESELQLQVQPPQSEPSAKDDNIKIRLKVKKKKKKRRRSSSKSSIESSESGSSKSEGRRRRSSDSESSGCRRRRSKSKKCRKKRKHRSSKSKI